MGRAVSHCSHSLPAGRGHYRRNAGLWVAYFNIPSFIYYWLACWSSGADACRARRPVGRAVSGRVPETIVRLYSGNHRHDGWRLSDIIIIGVLADFMIWQNVKSRQRHIAHEVETEPFGLFRHPEHPVLFGDCLFVVADFNASRIAERPHYRENILIAAYAFPQSNRARAADLCGGWGRHAAKLSRREPNG